jgi:NADH:ubiquinone oxidoreductase subunit F (NADH-binding)
MTATIAAPVSRAWTVGAARLLAGLDEHESLDHSAHLAVHGAMPHTDRARLTALLEHVALTGRGGAGFPFATKLRAMPHRGGTVVVNGSESEPASLKDRTLLRRTPHLVLDGALAVASAIGARSVTVAVHDASAAMAVRWAIAQRPDAGRVQVELVDGGFVAGEVRALVRRLGGSAAIPPGRRVHLTEQGTLVSNVETFAQVAVAIRLGPHRYRDTGTHAEPGTTLLTIGGAVARPGVVEIPIGTPLGIMLSAAGAADAQAVIIGGYHGTWLAPQPQLRLSRAGLDAAGGSLGAGVLLVVDNSTCALGELTRVATWLAAQSARQCGPCHFGLPALARDVAALAGGTREGLASAVRHAHLVQGRGACHHPDDASRFVLSGLHVLRQEIESHLARGNCGRPVLGRLEVAP